MSENATLKINVEALIPRRVQLCWPKPDTRLPESERPKPSIDGYVDCEYRYFSQDDLGKQDEQIREGELEFDDRFQMLVPVIRGLPLKDGESVREFLNTNPLGAIIRSAIHDDYFAYIREGRRPNSAKRR